MIIKGYTNFGIAAVYKFVICNNTLAFNWIANDMSKINYHSDSFWDFIDRYEIRYWVNIMQPLNNKYKIANRTISDRERNTTRQIIKNELAYKKFNRDFEDKLNN